MESRAQNKIYEGVADITDHGIKNLFRKFEPYKCLFELAWNGFDAEATEVRIDVIENQLGGLELVRVTDNGTGIDVENTKINFGKFNESSKKLDDDKHGSHGKGRLSFHKLSDSAVWHTKRANYSATINIDALDIKNFKYQFSDKHQCHETLTSLRSGTCVELSHFRGQTLPEENELRQLLSEEFGWRLALNPSLSLLLNGQEVPVPDHEIHEETITVGETYFDLTLIRWEKKPSSEKSYNYLLGPNQITIKKELSKFNNKLKFYSSTFVSSEFLKDYDPRDIEMDPKILAKAEVLNQLKPKILDFQTRIYKDFLRRFVDQQIESFEEKGFFPEHSGANLAFSNWQKQNTKSVIRDIYISDPKLFSSLNGKQTKILIRLIDRLLISNENDSLFDVLDSVLDLGDKDLQIFANQIERTKLENIVSTIEELQKRESAIRKLREVMETRYAEIKETPDLQRIIENNTWLFGAQYETIGAEEDDFIKTANNLRNKIKEIDTVDPSDIDDADTIDGIKRQVDLFLARKKPAFDGSGNKIYKCVIVEIKRPGISLNKKHLEQLEDYRDIIEKHPSFSSPNMQFDLILIGRKISKDDLRIKQRLDDHKEKGEFGLVSTGRIKCYVKDWFSIFNEFELTNSYLIEKLTSKLEDLSKARTEDLVESLQK